MAKINLLLGVTASVAAIKACPLAKALVSFANIKLVSTEKAAYFLKSDYPTFQELAISCYADGDEWPPLKGQAYALDTPILHIELRRWADCFIIAPLDANTLAKISYGFCDNLLTSLVRAWDWSKPLVLCPAMNTQMWENNPTAEQIALVQGWGAKIIEPITKTLACKDIGMGGMAEVPFIVEQLKTFIHK